MINIGNIEHTDAKYILNICDKSGAVKAKVAIPDDAIQCKQLMKEDYIQFSFTYNTSILFVRGDYVDYQGTKYYLRSNYIPEEVDSSQFKYTFKLESEIMLLQDAQFYYTRQQLREASWSLTSDAASFIKVVADNANRYFGSTQWKVGKIEPAERKYISFDNSNVFDALTTIAQQFDAEWYVTDKTINLVNKFTFGSEIDFESEVNINGISRSEGEDAAQYTRILALGSTRNLPANYRQTDNGSTIEAVYKKRLRIPAAKGDIIDIKPNLSPNEVIETTVIFDDVYPKRVGKITEVTTKENTDKDGNTGVSTKWNSYRFKDSGLTFKSSYLLKDKAAELRIVFQSGKLNGLDFAVRFDPDNEGDNSPKAQVFEILRNENYGKSLPNDVLKPTVNDEYIMYGFDIQIVSNTYIPTAEQALYDKAMEWLQNNAKDKSVYSCPTVINAFAAKGMDLDIGQKVKLVKNQGGGRNYFRNSVDFKDLQYWSKYQPTGASGNLSVVRDGVMGSVIELSRLNMTGDLIFWQNSISVLNFEIGKEYTISFMMKGVQAGTMTSLLANNNNTVRVSPETTYNVPTEWTCISQTFKALADGPDIYLCLRVKTLNTLYISNLKLEEGGQATDWSLAPEDVEGGIRSSRIMGFEKKLYNKYDAKYTVGENAAYSRLANIEKSIDKIKYADQVFENTGNGNNIYLIKQFDNTTPTDFNAYSAKASDAKYFNKQTGGNVQDNTIFEHNMQVYGSAMADTFGNDTFTSGQFGSGFRIWKNKSDGQSYAEIDNLMVRREMQLNRLTIAEIKSVGGQILVSPANMLCSKMVDGGTYYQCFFDTDGGKIANTFAVDDQAICRRFNGKGMKYYWRRVTSVGTDYINLSKTDADGTGIPEVDDELILFGNRTNVSRQSAIVISSYGVDAPSIKQYAGINSYNLTGKEATVISPAGNKFSGTFEIKSATKTQSLEDYTNEKLNSIQIGGRNLIMQSKMTVSHYVDHVTGNIIPTADYAVTDFIGIELEGSFVISNKDKKTFRNVRIAYYDNNKSFISGQIWSSLAFVDKIISIPNNTRYIRFSANSALISNFNEVIKEYWKIELGNKVTDWTPAPEDVQDAIDAALSTADAAKTNATTANNLLADIANDNKLTATEKQDTKKEWGIIAAEYSKNISQASTFGMETTNYANAYNILNSSITPLLSNISVTSDINGGTFRTNFKNYYDAKLDLLNAIAVKSKQLAENAQNTADNIQIGGRNLVSNSKDTFTLKKIEGTATNENIAYTGHFVDLIANETYTFQCKTDGVWGASNDTVEAFAMKDKSAASGDYISFNTNPKTFVAPKTGRFYIRVDANNRQYTHSFWEFKIEKGNKATDWSPAPEDVQAGIDTMQDVAQRKVRYIRDYLNGSTANTGNHWVQIKALDNAGNNIALNKIAIFYRSDKTSFVQNRITNNDINTTTYTSGAAGLEYVIVDLGNVYDIEKVQVWHYYLDGRKYYQTKTEVSVDGTNWLMLFDSATEDIYKETAEGSTYYVKEYNSTVRRVDSLKTSLGAMAWEEKVETARLGTTIIEGGFIKASLINVNSIKVSGLFATSTDIANAETNARNFAAGQSYQGGKILYRDIDFRSGWNGIATYNNAVNGNVILTRITRPSDCPTTSTHCLEIKNIGAASPNLGGFSYATLTRANAKFITRIIAKIPIGYSLTYHSNSVGNEGSQRWVGSVTGTGQYAEYICVVQCGATGTFSTTNFFALFGTAGTSAVPVYWYLASATVYDMTQPEIDYPTDAQTRANTAQTNAINSANQASQYLREAFTNDTTITGGVIGTSLIKVGAISSAGTWVEKAGINGAGSGTSTVRFYSGGTLTQASNLVNQAASNKASFAVTEGGKLYSEDAVISGIINATSGKIGGFTISENILTNTAPNSAIMFSALSGASYMQINGSTSTLLNLRADSARTGISIQTYATGARGIYIVANAGSSYAIESYGPHRFGQRYSESWNAPGVLFSALVKNSSTLYNQWGNGMTINSFQKTGTGVFDVTHNLGHNQYTVLATSYWDSATNYHSNAYVRVEYIGINSFRLRVVNSDNGGLVDTNFTFVVFGRNVW